MVFTAGQMFGIAAFTATVVAIGALLLKLDSMIGTNYDADDTAGDGGAGSQPSLTSAIPSGSASGAHRAQSGQFRRRRRR